MNLEKLKVMNATERVTEQKEVSVTIAFDFKDGKCTDATLQPLYDFLMPHKEEAQADEVAGEEPKEQNVDLIAESLITPVQSY